MGLEEFRRDDDNNSDDTVSDALSQKDSMPDDGSETREQPGEPEWSEVITGGEVENFIKNSDENEVLVVGRTDEEIDVDIHRGPYIASDLFVELDEYD